MSAAVNLIEDRFHNCDELFENLERLLGDSEANELSGQIDINALRNEHIRFKKWAQNAGAHRSDRVSLEYRLREASKLKDEVMNIMGELKDTLSEGTLTRAILNKTS